MPTQFIRLNCYGEQPNAGRKPHENACAILDEAARVSGSAPHVLRPQPPTKLYGIPIASVREKIVDFATMARDRRGARLRRDSTVLYAIVASYPVAWRHLGSDKDIAAYGEWLDMVVGWLKSQFADTLQTVVEHRDEGQPHVHAFVIPPLCPRNRIDHRLHPGHAAREAAFERGDDRLGGERAYREGMRNWQDAFHSAVSCHFGHDRIGPRRKRFRRDVALIRQSSDRFLERAETIVTLLTHRLDRLPAVVEWEERVELDAIAELLHGARGRLLGGYADAMENLETALAGLVNRDAEGPGEGESLVTDDALNPAHIHWADEDEPRPADDVDDDDDPDPDAHEDPDSGADVDGDYEGRDDDGPESDPSDWPDELLDDT